MKALLCILFILLLSQAITGQKIKLIKMPSQLYAGGQCVEEGRLCGLYWVRNNNTFLFIEGGNGFIKSAGTGTWKAQLETSYEENVFHSDTIVYFKFKPSPDLRLLKGIIDYHSETTGSPDSIYVEGLLKLENGEPAEIMDVSLNQKKVAMTDTFGFFKFRIPFSKVTKQLKIHYNSFMKNYPVYLDLNLNHNYHRVNMVLPSLGDNPFIPIEDDRTDLKFLHKPHQLGLYVPPQKKDFLLQLLKDAEKNQPLFKHYFIWLRNELNK